MSESSGAEGVRQRNLSRLLRLVHLEGPLSRAALTEATSLNRSTVADLVTELVERGVVKERAPDPSRRVGRPSPVVEVSPDVVAIAVNPEIDAVTIAAVRLDHTVTVRERVEVETLPTAPAVARLVADRIKAWRKDELADAQLVAVGLAVPGLVRQSDGLVRRAPHLEWTNVPLRDLVAEATGLPTFVGNDATLGTWAEHLFGAARGVDDVVYLNGGASGIGGGLIVGGALVSGAGGYAGEFGQNRPGIVSQSDRRAGDDGVLEDEVSRARLLAVAGVASADDPTLAAALRADTPSIVHEIERQRRVLSTALANAVNVLNPATIVLGGFLAILAEHDLDGLTELVRRQSMPANAEDLTVCTAGLGDDRLLIGAAELAFADLMSNPSSTRA